MQIGAADAVAGAVAAGNLTHAHAHTRLCCGDSAVLLKEEEQSTASLSLSLSLSLPLMPILSHHHHNRLYCLSVCVCQHYHNQYHRKSSRTGDKASLFNSSSPCTGGRSIDHRSPPPAALFSCCRQTPPPPQLLSSSNVHSARPVTNHNIIISGKCKQILYSFFF